MTGAAEQSGEVRVTCPDYSRVFKSRADAERWRAQVEAAGHCQHLHTITEGGPMSERYTDADVEAEYDRLRAEEMADAEAAYERDDLAEEEGASL